MLAVGKDIRLRQTEINEVDRGGTRIEIET